MTHDVGTQSAAHNLARVRGRSIGSMVFAAFGGLWLALSAFAFGHLAGAVTLCLALGTLALAGAAISLLRSVPKRDTHGPEEQRDGRRFAWVNAGQGVAIFFAVQVSNNLHHPNAAFPRWC